MKGDEGIQLREEASNLLLLLRRARQSEHGFKEIVWRNIKQPVVSRAFSSDHLHRAMPAIRLVIRYQEIRVSLIKPEADVQCG